MCRTTEQLDYKPALRSSQAHFDAAPPVYPSGMRDMRWSSYPSVSFSLEPGVLPSASPGPLDSVAPGFSDLASGLRDVSLRLPPQYPAKKGAFSGPGLRQEPFSSGPPASSFRGLGVVTQFENRNVYSLMMLRVASG